MDFVEGKSIIITQSENMNSIHQNHDCFQEAEIFKYRNITESAQNILSKGSMNKRNYVRTN